MQANTVLVPYIAVHLNTWSENRDNPHYPCGDHHLRRMCKLSNTVCDDCTCSDTVLLDN